MTPQLPFSRFLQVRVHQSPLVVDLRRALFQADEPRTLEDVINALRAYYSMRCVKQRYGFDAAVGELWSSYNRVLSSGATGGSINAGAMV